MDAFDKETLGRGRRQETEAVDVVYKIMDGETVNIAAMPKDIQNYAKTARVIMGQVLFSDSWLEV